jgi:hypothetical protein
VIVIFGIRRRAHRMATVFALCRLCGSPAAQAITRVRTFFSLFFVPVIPLGSTYRSTCTLCGRAVKLSRADAEQLVAQDLAAPGRPGPFQAGAGSSAPYPLPAMPAPPPPPTTAP